MDITNKIDYIGFYMKKENIVMELEYLLKHIEQVCKEGNIELSEDDIIQVALGLNDHSHNLVQGLGGGFKGNSTVVECEIPNGEHFVKSWKVNKCNSCGRSFCRSHQFINCPVCNHGRLY
jgi:hypothetical protein